MQIQEYLYTGDISITEEQDEQHMLLDALHLAHIWNIPSFIEEMQNQLIKHISLDTYETCGLLFYGQLHWLKQIISSARRSG
jgi:hypothetical protein